MPQLVETVPGTFEAAPVKRHFRITTGAAANLKDLCSIPTKTVNGTLRYPRRCRIAVEKADAANNMFYTSDGQTPTATLGMQIAVAPDYTEIIGANLFRTNTPTETDPGIIIFSSAGSHGQVEFFF